MQDVNSDRDRLVLEDITEMRNRTEEREAKVSDITEKLDDQLVLLTEFLENVGRRPHGKRAMSLGWLLFSFVWLNFSSVKPH